MSPPFDSSLPFPDWVILLREIRIDKFKVKPLPIQGSGIRDQGPGTRDQGSLILYPLLPSLR